MFFSPSRAVLSAILRDECLTSAVRTKEGDKAGSNQPPARDPVQFKLDLTRATKEIGDVCTQARSACAGTGYVLSFLSYTLKKKCVY